jgi:pimeloyl-ACP methyl ester carboxylesterase
MNTTQLDHGRAADPFEATPQMIDVGGRRVAAAWSGAAAPTVVLETGLGAESHDWAAVQRGLEGLACVLRYDRAGRGASDATRKPRRASHMIADLHELLRKTAVPPPFLLVGHSFGGLLVRLYAHRHPTDVCGLVLVDSMHEDQFDVFGPLFPPADPSEPPLLRHTRAFWTGGWRDPRSTQEGIDMEASIREGRAIESLGALPMHVITAGTFLNQPAVPSAPRAALQGRWDQLQRRFLKLSALVSQTSVPSSGHFVQRDQPQVVIDVIAKMLHEVGSKPRAPAVTGSAQAEAVGLCAPTPR